MCNDPAVLLLALTLALSLIDSLTAGRLYRLGRRARASALLWRTRRAASRLERTVRTQQGPG